MEGIGIVYRKKCKKKDHGLFNRLNPLYFIKISMGIDCKSDKVHNCKGEQNEK